MGAELDRWNIMSSISCGQHCDCSGYIEGSCRLPISMGYACFDYWTMTTPATSVLRSIPSLSMYSTFLDIEAISQKR